MLYDFYQLCCPYERERRSRIRQTNPFDELNDSEFVERFRLSKNVVLRLLQEVQFLLHVLFTIVLKSIHSNWPYAVVDSLPHGQMRRCT